MLYISQYILILFTPLLIFSQTKVDEEGFSASSILKYEDFNYKPNIKTIQFYESSWEYAPPIIDLNNNEQLHLSFDDLDADQKQYSVSFIHCNSDWTPSDLMISEYLNGFFDLNILNFSFSANTFQKYTHFSILFPVMNTQINTQFTKSGNYLLYVYANGDKNDLVFSRRFMVYDNKVSLAINMRQTIGGEEQFKKQHLDFSISSNGYQINNPYKDLKVTITQNNRWDNAVYDIKPTFMNGNEFSYSLDDASTFNGGNEFRFFDIRSLRFLTEKVKDIYKDDDLKNHVVLYPDQLRLTKPYLFYNDFNGYFIIKNRETMGDQNLEADYVFVEFFLPYAIPESKGSFYILGKLTDWKMNKNSKMTYNHSRLGYETKLYLKQGYYNYIYVLSDDEKKGGNETITEGNHWDTENDYCIYVYHRKFGTYYDQLIGLKKINSIKK